MSHELPGDEPRTIDLESLELGPLLKHARTATFAPNWKTVLAADAFVGVLMATIGVMLAGFVHWAGWIAAAIGVIYVLFVGRRFLRWRWLRTQAGL